MPGRNLTPEEIAYLEGNKRPSALAARATPTLRPSLPQGWESSLPYEDLEAMAGDAFRGLIAARAQGDLGKLAFELAGSYLLEAQRIKAYGQTAKMEDDVVAAPAGADTGTTPKRRGRPAKAAPQASSGEGDCDAPDRGEGAGLEGLPEL